MKPDRLPNPHRASAAAPPPNAFAMVLALLVLALLIVTIVGSSLMLQVEVRTADNSRQILEARQNALYGLGIAFGELQQIAGPDQRVTATASLTRNATSTQWDPANVATNSPHRNWTGVWDTSAPRFIPDATPGKVISNVGTSTNQLNPEPIAWLVSGGKNRKTSSGNATQTSDVTPDTYPARVSTTGRPTSVTAPDDHVVLLGNGTVDLAAHPENGIVVPKVAIMKPNPDGSTSKSGAYGYWVADEGVKARFDAVESEAFANTGNATSQKDYRVLGAQRIGAEQMSTGNGTDTFATIGYDPKGADFLKKIRSLAARDQIGLLDYTPSGNSTFRPAAKARFHDITTVSEGVLSDTRKGGLKQDLTVYLQQGSVSGIISDTDLLFSDSRDTSGVTDPKNPRAPLAIRYPSLSLTGNSTGLPKFGLLKSWYQMDAANPQIIRRTSTQHGLYPVVVRAEWPIWMHVNLDMTGATFPFTVPTTAFTPRIYPVVTLWNPYNVTLPGRDYLVQVHIGKGAIVGFKTDGNQTMAVLPNGSLFSFPLPPSISLYIPAAESSLPAGETKIYILKNNQAGYDGTTVMEMISGYFAPSSSTPNYSLSDPPKATNQNNYFELPPPGGPNITVPAMPGSGSKTLIAIGAYAGNGTSSSDPLNRSVSLYLGSALSSATPGNMLQNLTPITGAYSWVGSGSNDTNWLLGTTGAYFSYNGTNAFDFDAKIPRSGWHIRPMSHYTSAWASKNWTGGSFAPLLDCNNRVGADAVPASGSPVTVPFVDLNATRNERERFWGPYRYMPDGNNSDIVGPSVYLYSFGGSPASERFAYAYGDTLYKNPDTSSGPVTSSSFSLGSGLGKTTSLFDLKPAGRELVSLGYLQHANLDTYVWQPSYVAGNSWVPPQLAGRDRYSGFFSGTPAPAADTANKVYDISYLVNDSLWDRFYLSSSSSTSSQDADLLANKKCLPSSRLRFREINGTTYNSLTSSADKMELGAGFLTLNGAFNINSTSVEAWKAFLSSRNGLDSNSAAAGATEAVFSRMLNPGASTGGFLAAPATGQPAGEIASAYTGARKLSAGEVTVLAEKIVEQVRLRGPFTSLSDFVNRRLTMEPAWKAPETAVSQTGFVGPLQAAIDFASDQYIAASQTGINSMFYQSAVPGSYFDFTKIPAKAMPNGGNYVRLTAVDEVDVSALVGPYFPKLRMLGKPWYYSAAGVPGFLTQADILSGLGHLMSARSDTFTIRSYGEVTDKSGKIICKAWCEAVVQRTPDPVKSNPGRSENIWPENPTNVASDPVNALGRKFIIKSFRWLTPEEV
jgi:hypothetical protein